MDIYNRINEHKMINNEDIKNIINNRLKEINLSTKENHVIFSDEKNLYFRYITFENNIYVANNYKKLTLLPILESDLVKVVKKRGKKNTFLTDIYNLELLICPYHEVRHAEQYHILIDKEKNYNTLIKKSLSFTGKSLKFYQNNHPKFLSEHDAELSSMMLVLEKIEKGNLNVCTKSICFFNMNIAYFILRSRGYELDINTPIKTSIFKSPLHMLYAYNKSLYLKKEIDVLELENTNKCITEIRNNNKTEYDRIISGDNLSDETINELFLIEKGIIKTENIFKYFENKELDKNNNHYIKKLLLNKE